VCPMRQPDGRPRGFGYVTVDSPVAAEYFLSRPQMIDNRYVDLKPAVPDGATGDGNNCGNAVAGPSLQLPSCWPPHGTHQEFFPLPAPGIQDASPLTLLSCQTQPTILPGPPPGLLEPPPVSNSLVTGQLLEQRPPQAFEAKKMPLRDVTNLLDGSSVGGLKLPDVLAAKPATVQPALTMGYVDTSGSDDGDFFVLADEDEPEQEHTSSPKLSSATSIASGNDENEPNNQQLLKAAEKLPSLGSANHATGECRQCNFFAKGRCRNGHDCNFCHFPHQRKNKSCQEKREAQSEQPANSQLPGGTWDQHDRVFCGTLARVPPPGLSPLPMHYGSMTHPMHSSCLTPHGTSVVPLLSTQPVLQTSCIAAVHAVEITQQVPQHKEVATQTPPGGLGCRLCGKDSGFMNY